MINTEITQFQQSIVPLINVSPLPIEVKRLVVSEILTNIADTRNQVIQQEKQQMQDENKEKTEENQPCE